MIQKQGNLTVITPPERFDTNSSPEAEAEAIAAIEDGESRIIIDLSGSSFVSSAGLRVILKVAKLLHQQKGALVLCGLSEQITEVFEVSGFMTLVNVHSTLAEATEAINSMTS